MSDLRESERKWEESDPKRVSFEEEANGYEKQTPSPEYFELRWNLRELPHPIAQ